MDRVLRWVWLVNGVLLLGMLVLGVVFVAGAWVTDLVTKDPGVAVAPRVPSGEENSRAVRYELPSAIRGTQTHIVLIRHGRANATSSLSRGDYDGGASPIINVAFLDAAGGRLLLDRPAYLAAVSWPGEGDRTSRPVPDSLLRQIVYEMALEDSDGDGKLDHRDRASLYVSDLEGRNLRRVLPAGMVLRAWEPLADGSLLITALEAPAAGGADTDEMPQRSFIVGGDGRVRPHAALDSVAATAGRILRN